MKSVVETLNPTRVRLAVEVPFTELEADIKSAYKQIASQVTVPGFRKGKVPPLIIDKRFGRPVVLEQAVNDALPKLYSQAVQDNELRPLGQPEVDVTEFSDGEELKFTAEVDVRPQIDLPAWEELEVQVDDLEVSESEIDEQLSSLRSRFGTLTGVDRAAGDGDFVVIDLSATQDGQPIEGGQATGVSYQVGSGSMVEGLDEAVTGLSAGESTSFRTTLLGTNEGQEVDCAVTVTSVQEQELPDLDDEFAQLASEFDTLEELRADLHEKVARTKRLEQAGQARDRVLDALLEAAGDVPLPEKLLTAQIDEHFNDGHGDEGHRDEYEQDLRKNLKAQFVLDELGKAQSVEVSQEELTSHILQRAAQSGVDPNQLAQQYVQSGNLPALMAEVARGKALAQVVEKARITDASGQPVELARLQEDGSLADEADLEKQVSSPVAPGFEFAELDDDAQDPADAENADDAEEAAEDVARGSEAGEDEADRG